MEKPTTQLQTVDRALQLLECFTVDRPAWGITELARELGIAKSMVVRLLDTLVTHGFVERNPETRRYTLGLRLIRLGLQAQAAVGNLNRVASPIMESLTAATGETTQLCVPRGTESICLGQVVSPQQQLRLAIDLGTASPLTAGATNKVLLAFLPESRIDEIIAMGLTAYTPQTVTDPDLLRAQLQQIREQGWAASSSELSPDVAAVAAPIFDPQGQIIASLTVGGPAWRFSPDRIPKLAPQVKSAAETLTRRLAGD